MYWFGPISSSVGRECRGLISSVGRIREKARGNVSHVFTVICGKVEPPRPSRRRSFRPSTSFAFPATTLGWGLASVTGMRIARKQFVQDRPPVGWARGFSRSGPPPPVPRQDDAERGLQAVAFVLFGWDSRCSSTTKTSLRLIHIGTVCPPVAPRETKTDCRAGQSLPTSRLGHRSVCI